MLHLIDPALARLLEFLQPKMKPVFGAPSDNVLTSVGTPVLPQTGQSVDKPTLHHQRISELLPE